MPEPATLTPTKRIISNALTLTNITISNALKNITNVKQQQP